MATTPGQTTCASRRCPRARQPGSGSGRPVCASCTAVDRTPRGICDEGAGPCERESFRATLTIVPAPRSSIPGRAARVSNVGATILTLQQLPRLVGRQVGERHVVRDAGVVDQHRQRLVGTADRRPGRCRRRSPGRRRRPGPVRRAATQQAPRAAPSGGRRRSVMAVVGQSFGKGLADPGGGTGDEREGMAPAFRGDRVDSTRWTGEAASAKRPVDGSNGQHREHPRRDQARRHAAGSLVREHGVV